MTASVVVISFNQRLFIERLATQLLDQDYAADDYEIVVVECASSDDTIEWLRSKSDSRLNPLYLTEQCNRSQGRNQGIRAARGDIIIMIDGDHTVSKNFVSAHVEAHKRGKCAIVGKSDFAPNPNFKAINDYLNNGGAAKFPASTPLPGRYFLTRNCSVPKQVLLEIGLFDETFDRWGGEDLDLGVRLEQAGIPIYGDNSSLALHHHFRTIDEVLSIVRLYGEGSVPRLVEKHPQLFRELNLDRLFNNPYEVNRFGAAERFVNRLLCSAPVFQIVRAYANIKSRSTVPRFVFDYLHLRQYAAGYRQSQKNK
ncbi:MAG: glycosyltransferase [Calditrichaeota bacterium]|nr:glycosyltransferase [Calditrichota bacterium]